MAERERSRSRSPPPAEDAAPAAEENGAPPEAAPAPAPAADGGDGGGASDEVKLYVGNLDYATDEERLRSEFGQFGTVTDVFLPTERDTGRPRGFGFVTFSTRTSAESAISKMDQTELDGRTIRVNESRPKGERSTGPGGQGGFNAAGAPEVKLYVGNLSFDTPDEAVRRLFEQHGTVSDCFLPTDRDTGKVRGFAFVTMPAAEAEKACNAVNGQELDGRTLRVNEAQPKGSGGGGRGGGGGGYGGGGYDDRGGGYGGGGGGYGGGYGGGGGYDRGGGGGYDRGGYGGGGGGYDRGGYGGGGGYDDRGGYGGSGGGGYGGGGGGYDRGGGRGGYDDRGGYGGGGGGGGYSGGGGGGYDRY